MTHVLLKTSYFIDKSKVKNFFNFLVIISPVNVSFWDQVSIIDESYCKCSNLEIEEKAYLKKLVLLKVQYIRNEKAKHIL